MKLWLAVATSGAVGALLRVFLSAKLQSIETGRFPLGTLGVNLLGCLAIGFLWPLFLNGNATLRAAIFGGFLGAFTTFSTFGLEAIRLFQNSHHAAAGLYLLVSNLAGLSLVAVGIELGKWFKSGL